MSIAGRRYAVGLLEDLRTVREPGERVGFTTTALACVMAVAGAAVLAASAEPALMFGGPILAVLPVGAAFLSWRLRRRSLALYAEYQGRTVEILRTQDERRYNQIGRALLRAREYDLDRDRR